MSGAGDPRAALRSRMYLRYQPLLAGFIRSLVFHPQDAEDLLQEVGVVVLTREDVPLDAAEFPRWCRGVARNLVLHYRRAHGRAKVRASDGLLAAMEAAYVEADREVADWEAQRRALAECLTAIDARSARLLAWRYIDGLTSESIGERIRQSAASVRMTLMRLRKVLQKCVDKRIAGA